MLVGIEKFFIKSWEHWDEDGVLEMLVGIEKFFIKSWEHWEGGEGSILFFNKNKPLELTDHMDNILRETGLDTLTVDVLEISLEDSAVNVLYPTGRAASFPIKGITL